MAEDSLPVATAASPPASAARAKALLGVLLLVQVVALYWPHVGTEGPVTGTDKAVHALLFLLPTWAAIRARAPWSWAVVALVAVHAPVSELVQGSLLSGRSGDVRDVVADLVGVVLGVTLGVVGRTRTRW